MNIEECLTNFHGQNRKPSAEQLNLLNSNEISLICCKKGDWIKPFFQDKINALCLYKYIKHHNLDLLIGNQKNRTIIEHYRISVDQNISIETISQKIIRIREQSDFLICQIQPSTLLPRLTSLNCFEIYIRSPSICPPISPILMKLTVIFRHANRYPIGHISRLDNLIHLDPAKSGKITQDGLIAALNFGQNLQKVYDPSIKSVKNYPFCISSPSERCIQTATEVINGFRFIKSINPEINSFFKIKLVMDESLIKVTDTINELGYRAAAIVEKVSQICNLPYINLNPIRALFVSSKLTQRLIVYEDLGLNMDSILGSELWLELRTVAGLAYNLIQNWTYLQNQDLAIKWFDILRDVNMTSRLVLCCTHDSVLSIMMQYLRLETNYPFNFQYPGYLANIRIEYWSDGILRIFYNNTQLQ